MTEHDEPNDLSPAQQTLKAFEQILEVMPNDRETLEAALMTAHHCGEEEKALGYRLRLADCLVADNDEVELAPILDLLRASEDPRAKEWVALYDQKEESGHSSEMHVQLIEDDQPIQVSVSDEMDLAWKLFEHGDLTQDEYASVVRDLTELSTSENKETISVLHALEATHHKNLERILDYLSEATRTPYISLACFDLRAECAQFLSAAFIRHRGALVFDLMGTDLLVAVLNPLNKRLRADIEDKTGHHCHFYLTRASEFETAMHKLIATQTEQGDNAE